MILVLAAVLVGAALQRVSGIGFAVVVAPCAILALGPGQGVVLVQLCGVASAVLVLSRVHRDVDWRAWARLVVPGVLGVGAGAVAAARLPDGPAQVLGAVVVLATLAGSVAVGRLREVPRTTGVVAAAGGTAGVLTVLAGVGAGPLTALQQATRWEHRTFVATLQPALVTLSGTTVVARLAATPGAWPALAPPWWAAVAAALAAGIAAGGGVARRLSPRAAGHLSLVLAAAGGVSALVDGLAGG